MVLYGDSRFDKNKYKFVSEATIKKKVIGKKSKLLNITIEGRRACKIFVSTFQFYSLFLLYKYFYSYHIKYRFFHFKNSAVTVVYTNSIVCLSLLCQNISPLKALYRQKNYVSFARNLLQFSAEEICSQLVFPTHLYEIFNGFN